MTRSVERRRINAAVSVGLQRTEPLRSAIPAEGMTRTAFVRAVLHDVDPALVDEVMTRLHRRGAIWVRRLRGYVRVHGTRPTSIAADQRIAVSAVGKLVGLIASHMLALVEAVNARQAAREAGAWEDEGEREADVRMNCACIVPLIRRYKGKDLALPDLRTALWRLFPADAMHALARHEPALHHADRAERFARVEAKPIAKRIPSGLSVEGKVIALVRKGSVLGQSRTDLAKAIRPKLSRDALDATLKALETEGRLVSGKMRLQRVGRPGVRYFAPEVGLPTLRPDGTAVARTL